MSDPAKYYGHDLGKGGTYKGFTIDGQESNLSPYREYNHGDRVTILTEISWFTGHKYELYVT